jgi:trans-aconitate 2-methyltransferase
VNAVIRDLGIDERATHLFATADETAIRLAGAGFVDVRTWLQPEPTRIDDGAWEAYLRTVCLSGYLARMPAAEHDTFVAEVIRRLERPELDYVRLNIDATRAA